MGPKLKMIFYIIVIDILWNNKYMWQQCLHWKNINKNINSTGFNKSSQNVKSTPIASEK